MLGRTGKALRQSIFKVCAAAVLCAGCIPVPTTTTLSPPIVGTIRNAGRVPLAGQRLVLSVDDDGGACTRPAYTTVSDAAGAFSFPPVTRREPFTAVLFERLLCYSICGGEAADPLTRRCSLHRVPAADTLTCIMDAGGVDREAERRCLGRPRARRG